MTQRHLILRPHPEDSTWQGVLQASDGRLTPLGTDTLDALRAQAPDAACRVLAPGARVLLTQARIPTRNPRALRRALPYALEDQLADDVEILHFAPGTRRANGDLTVAVVSQADMQAWLDGLRGAGIQPAAMIPDTAVLPAEADAWVLWLEGEGGWLSMGEGRGTTLERDNAAFLLRRCLEETPEGERPQHLKVLRHGSGRPGDDALRTLQEDSHGMELTLSESPSSLLEHLAAHWPARPPLNLLCGPYSPRDSMDHLWRSWRIAASVLLAWVVIQFVGLGWNLQSLGAEQTALEERMIEVYQQTFPGGRIVDPRRQMETALRGLSSGPDGSGSDLQNLLTRAAPALAGEEGLSIQGLRYQAGRLDLDLHLRDLQGLDRLKQKLEQEAGWAVDIQSASARNDRVESRILIRSSGS
ncbi:type II secretion system protein GspL [Ectothiorhodospira sp. BSL-9]|uniref:type II secretion system protein GspL n=1 Tax=Ectothiorhodospira sp. BSL-9 TaxID=1442136 RepID=UPI0007B426C6|nr:type II secretion system protein GspL [Ectothiorhodospira sp. BSL-9]ANB01643.1 hypothetical protein ECTOBSL9_0801 [Ectothiorhodospira sp. BSL-9]